MNVFLDLDVPPYIPDMFTDSSVFVFFLLNSSAAVKLCSMVHLLLLVGFTDIFRNKCIHKITRLNCFLWSWIIVVLVKLFQTCILGKCYEWLAVMICVCVHVGGFERQQGAQLLKTAILKWHFPACLRLAYWNSNIALCHLYLCVLIGAKQSFWNVCLFASLRVRTRG